MKSFWEGGENVKDGQTQKLLGVEELRQMIDLYNPCTDDYLFVLDFQTDSYYISPHARERFQLPGCFFHDVQNNLLKVTCPEDRQALMDDLIDIMSTDRTAHNLIYRWMGTDGRPVWINCRGHIVRQEGKPVYMVGCINEIGKKQKADNVSGLLGETSLQQYLQGYTDAKPEGYFLRLGLDNFKSINAKLGIEYGDMVLRRMGDFIVNCVHADQHFYRIMADEFMVVDFHGGTAKDAMDLYTEIRRILDQYVEENHYEAFVTVSGGILMCQDVQNFTWSQIMKLSEFALTEAKVLGKNRGYIFLQEDYDAFLKRKYLTQALRQAVSDNFKGFEVYYQPIFHSKDSSLSGAEALLRFHSDDILVMPGEFIEILEETGLIIPVGRWVLHEALRFAKKSQKVVPDFRVNVNVSYVQVMKSDVVADIMEALELYDLKPSDLIVELTESGLVESDTYFTRLWKQLKENGVRLALDDFGTGYSNFHYLNELRPDIIKIDRSFTERAMSNEYEFNLLSLLNGMVKNLELKVCVEGVETEEERDKIALLPPDYSQGFFFGRPCAQAVFEEKFIRPLIDQGGNEIYA
ncbi:MAG: GGDEF and EAL domain-containing protein [Lachnospiraceae bacterium]|nr:GGDEF and EAL domain-containing protein [Lachnospiraceae bacterium]